MPIDFNKTLATVKGGILEPENTWKTYLETCPGWQQTALTLTGPLLVANVVLSLIFSRLVGGYAPYGYRSGWFMSLVLALVMAVIGFCITVFVFNFLAGVFKGAPNFSRAFAAVSLAVIPAWVAGAVGSLIPYLGFLLVLAGSVLSLVYLYRILPLALNLPQDKRVLHFIASLLLIIVINMVLGAVLGMGSAYRGADDYAVLGDSGKSNSMIDQIARQSELIQAASADQYDPPGDGKLDEEQVENYISVIQQTRKIQAKYHEEMERVAADMQAREEAGENISLADLGKAYSSASSVMGANTAEMEVVKSARGNWAEHEWVKQQLRNARNQQGQGSEATAHNYRLYQEYENDLNED